LKYKLESSIWCFSFTIEIESNVHFHAGDNIMLDNESFHIITICYHIGKDLASAYCGCKEIDGSGWSYKTSDILHLVNLMIENGWHTDDMITEEVYNRFPQFYRDIEFKEFINALKIGDKNGKIPI